MLLLQSVDVVYNLASQIWFGRSNFRKSIMTGHYYKLCIYICSCIRCSQVSIVRITDPDQYAALEQQIREFGQIPDQLFMEPHPSKTIQVYAFGFLHLFQPCHGILNQ